MQVSQWSSLSSRAAHPRWESIPGAGQALGARVAASALSSRLACPSRQPAGRRRHRTLVGAGGLVCQFDSNLNFNPLDYLKVPRHQVQMTLYPWMEAHERRERMRSWLQTELCMTETQARSVLTRCPSLADLDVRLAQRRLRQLDRDLHISRGEAALLVLRHPQQLLPPVADVVNFAVQHRVGPPRTRPGASS